MLDLTWIAVWMLYSLAAGLPLVRLLPAESFQYRVLAAPAIGYSMLAMVTTVCYAAGLSLGSSLYLTLILSAGGCIWWLTGRMWKEFKGTGIVFALWVLTLLVFWSPKSARIYQSFVFQWNPWYTFGYLKSALVYARTPYEVIRSSTSDAVAGNTLVYTARINLFIRPSVHILYALFNQPDVTVIHQLHYTFLVFLISQLVLALTFMMMSLFGAPMIPSSIVAVSYTAGFWGHSIIDMKSWSQISFMAIHVVCVTVIAVAACAADALADPKKALRVAFAVATFSAAAVYLYPEAFLFHMPAIVAMAAIGIGLSRQRFRRTVTLTASIGVFALWLYPCYSFVASNGVRQARWAAATPVEWWTFFQAYLFGRQGIRSQSVSVMVDMLAGMTGLYFLTPSASDPRSMRLIGRLVLLAFCAGVILSALWIFRTAARRFGTRRVAIAFLCLIGVQLACVAYVASQKLWWAAGKGLTYASPYWIVFLCAPLSLVKQLNVARFLTIPSTLLVAAQVAFALARPVTGLHENGIHFAPPYPSANSADSKTMFRWNVDDAFRGAARCRDVTIDVPDEWLRKYLVVAL